MERDRIFSHATFPHAAAAVCPDCGAPLDRTQPDPERPGLMLGICGCGPLGVWCVLIVLGDDLVVCHRIPDELLVA